MKIKVSDLINEFKYALDNKWGYIYGAVDSKWTEEKQANTTNQMAIKYGKKWIGHIVTDCSGLFVHSFKKFGGSIYHGSNTIWRKYCDDSHKGKIGNIQIVPGMAVFKRKLSGAQPSQYKGDGWGDMYHIGLVIDNNGTVIEAKSTYYGVVTSKVSEWHYAAKLKDVQYGNVQTVEIKQQTQQMKQPQVKLPTGIINASPSLRIRQNPQITAAQIGKIPNGKTIQILSTHNGWLKTTYNGITGYVSADYVKLNS